MHVKTPVYSDKAYIEAKEQQLRDFVQTAVTGDRDARHPLLLLVRAPECLAARVLFAMSSVLASAGIRAQIIFAAGATVTAGESWNLSFDPAFAHETRILRDARFLDGHEQLVCGNAHVWFGDSMRREPDKRDAFSSFIPASLEVSNQARTTFARIWELAEPVYAHTHQPNRTPADRVLDVPSALAAGVAETLQEWSPNNRH